MYGAVQKSYQKLYINYLQGLSSQRLHVSVFQSFVQSCSQTFVMDDAKT